MDTKAFLFGVAASLVATFLAALYVKIKTGMQPSVSTLSTVFKLYRRLSDIGFRNLYASRADYSRYRGAVTLGDYLSLAHHRLFVVGLWMAQGVEIEGVVNSIRDLIRQRESLQVRIALINPNGNAVVPLSQYLGIEASEVRTRVLMSFRQLHEMREGLADKDMQRMEIRMYDSLPAFSSILIDPGEQNSRLQIDLKVYQQPRHSSFSIEFAGPGRFMVELLRIATEECFYNAAPFDPAILSQQADASNALDAPPEGIATEAHSHTS